MFGFFRSEFGEICFIKRLSFEGLSRLAGVFREARPPGLPQKRVASPQVRIIPLQLQRLFAQLLLLDQEAASTADLTDSFGWTSNEVGRQLPARGRGRPLECTFLSLFPCVLVGVSPCAKVQPLVAAVR